ncbi:807_t:CDS:10 [Diversispora eburnea]|uniref:807_t:CDS:1 n=2 Tax=Diversisporales TaxID=214509 RepID=A0A9N8YWX6_9GLOM|nr:807_t:CDS:10 [Diversispora eburnea]
MEHRSIILQSIQKIIDKIIENPEAANDHPKGYGIPSLFEQLWAFVASSSGITSSNAIKKLVALVKLNVIPWSQALNGLIDALPTVSGITLDNVIIGITDILIYQVESEIDSLDYKCPFNVKAFHDEKIHPLISAVTMRPKESFPILLLQLERIFDISRIKFITGLDSTQKISKYMQNLLEMMKSFFNFVLLDCSQELKENQRFWSSSVINFILNLAYHNIGDEFYSKFREDMLYYLISVAQRISLETMFNTITSQHSQYTQYTHYPKYNAISIEIYLLMQSLVHALELSFIRENLSSTFLKDFSVILGIHILSLACDAHHSNLSSIQYVSMFYHLFKLHQNYSEIISKPNYLLLWPSLSFLLLDCQSCEIQIMILEIMQKLIEDISKESKEDVSSTLINMAILPIFQVISESSQGISRINAMEILLMIQKINTIQRVTNKNNENDFEQIDVLLKSPSINGSISEILSETFFLLKNFSKDFKSENISMKMNLTLFNVPYLFHHEIKMKIYALDHLNSIYENNISLSQSQKFPIFLLFLYILRNDNSSLIHLHILYHSLPLISTNDPVISAKIIKITKSLIREEGDDEKTKLHDVGIRMLHKLWIKQKRFWKSLRFILIEWIKKRKLIVHEAYASNEKFKLEIAELLPFISTLLQSVVLHPKTLCLIIESLNSCVEANVIDIRAVWNILLVHVTEAIMKSKKFHFDIISRLCEFYKLVAKNSEGLLTLSHFFVPDILSKVFPESPKILSSILFCDSDEGINLCQMEEWQFVLSKIISHEIENLRRGLFKGVKVGDVKGDGKLISDNLNVSEFKKNNKQIITSIGDKIVNDWESGLVNPGLRVGYALASLICYQPSINKKQELISSSQDQQIDLKSTRFYKLMVNAIQDITLTDHWLIRLSIVLEWWNFFEMGLQELLSIHTSINRYYGNKDEVIIKKLWEDLMKRLDDVKFPITCQNIILALSGYCLALKSLNIVSAQEHAINTLNRILELLKQYDDDKNLHQNQISTLFVNEEVQFAIIMALGYLSSLIILDEKLIREVIDLLISKLNESPSETSRWTFLGAGYALGTLLSHISSSNEMKKMSSEIVSFLGELLTNNTLNDDQELTESTVSIDYSLGIMIGLSKINYNDEEELEPIYQKALFNLKEFVEKNGKINKDVKKNIAGAAWLVGFSEGKEVTEEIVELLGKVVKISSKEREWSGYTFHFTQAYSHVLHAILTVKQSSQYLSSYNSQVNAQVHMITSLETNINKRHAAILTLGSLAGVKYFFHLHLAHNKNFYFYSLAPSSIIKSVLDSLQNISGINTQGGRLAMIVFGRITQYALRLSEDDEFLDIESEKLFTSSTEQKNYSNLPPTSYLRVLFDSLMVSSLKAKTSSSQIFLESSSLIISTFSKVNHTIPPVNWFSLLSRLSNRRYDLRYKSVILAIRHWDALGKILEMCGFEKTSLEDGILKSNIELHQKSGMENIINKVVVPNSKVIEIIEGILLSLFNKNELQIIFLSTMAKYTLTGANEAKDSRSISSLRQEIKGLLKKVYLNFHPPSNEKQAQIIRLTIYSCIFDVEDINYEDNLLTRNGVNKLEYGVKIVLSGLVNLSWKESLTELFKIENFSKFYETWEEEFIRFMQDKTSTRKLSTKTKKTSKDHQHYEHRFILYSILTRLKSFIPNEEYFLFLDDDDMTF